MSRRKLGFVLGAALVTSSLAVMAPSLTTTAAGAEVVVDGGLESASGDPLDSPAWVEADSANDLLCSTAVCDLDGGRSVPHAGTTYAKFGPGGAGHTASLSQDVTIPDGAATLSYWLRKARAQAPFDSQLVVSVDGDVVKAHNEASFADPSYDKYSVNLASYADGGTHTLAFEYTDASGGASNAMLLDDVSIDAAAGPVGIAANPASLGPIPDGNDDCIQPGAPLDVTFAVTGISGHLADVAVRFKFDPAHPYVGDLGVTLIAPDGTTKAVIFDRTGQQAGDLTESGHWSDVRGPYLFSDAAPADPSWWTQSQLASERDGEVPAGHYRAAAAASSPAHGANTLITPAFANLLSPNGTWTLRFEDKCNGDFGTVASAKLLLTPGTTAPDTTAPDTTITSSPANGVAKSLKVPFGFSATEAGSSFLCAVDTAAFAACPNPATMTVTSGAHTFRVAARDVAGNVDASPATVSFKAYDCATLDAKVVKLTKKVTKLKKAIKATKKALAKAEDAGDKEKIKKLTTKLTKLKKQLKKAKKQLKKAKAADAPCKA